MESDVPPIPSARHEPATPENSPSPQRPQDPDASARPTQPYDALADTLQKLFRRPLNDIIRDINRELAHNPRTEGMKVAVDADEDEPLQIRDDADADAADTDAGSADGGPVDVSPRDV